MHICRFVNEQPVDIQPMPDKMGRLSNPRLDDILAYGWREHVPSTTPNIKTSHWENDGRAVRQVVDSVWEQADLEQMEASRLAAIEQSEAIRKATPKVYDQPHEFPLVSVLSQTGAKGVGITATDDGDLVTVIVHESPWPDRAALQAKIDTAIAKHRATKAAAKAGINGQIQNRLAALERMMGLRE